MLADITKNFAEFIYSTKYEDFPPEVIEQAKDFILDNIGCTLGSYAVAQGKIIAGLGEVFGSGDKGTSLATGKKESAFGAAYVNTKLCNFIDADETLYNFYHIGGVPFYAALHTAEITGAGGKEVIAATILGYEFAYRFSQDYALMALEANGDINVAKTQGYGFTTIAAAVAAAKILGLNVDQIRHAIGVAGYLTPVPCIPKWLLSPPLGAQKYQDMGWFASTGMQAAFMAQKGYTGDMLLLDDFGEYSFWKAFGMMSFNFEGMIKDLGRSWGIMEMGIKPAPCCRWYHTPIRMLKQIMEQNRLEASDIQSIKIAVPVAVYRSKAHNAGNWADWQRKDAVHSQYNLPYCISLAAHQVPEGPLWQLPEMLNDPAIGEYSKKVVLTEDEKCQKKQADYLRSPQPKGKLMTQVHYTLEVDTNKGSFTEEAEYIHGDTYDKQNALTKEELKQKFKTQAAYTYPEKSEEMIKAVYSLDQVGDINNFTKMFSR